MALQRADQQSIVYSPAHTKAQMSAPANFDQFDPSKIKPRKIKKSGEWGPRGPQESRYGIYWYNRRNDNEPMVWAELPSYPKFDEPIPATASLEEICEKYPNHVRGSYLEAFLQWRWSATDMWKYFTDHAKAELHTMGIARCRAAHNRCNFLFKRLAAHVRRMSIQKFRALCEAPKLRPALKDGRAKYGKSILQQKVLGDLGEPNWQPPFGVGQSHGLLEQNESVHSNMPTKSCAADVTPEVEKRTDPDPELEIFSKIMGLSFMEQISHCATIIKADPLCATHSNEQRRRWALSMLDIPVNAATETFLQYKAIWTCPAYLSWVEKKIEAVMERRKANDPLTTDARLPLTEKVLNPEVRQWIVDRKRATSQILEERHTISTILKSHAKHVGACPELSPDRHHRGLVIRVINQVLLAVGEIPTTWPGKDIPDGNAVEQVFEPTWTLPEQLAAALASQSAVLAADAEGNLYGDDEVTSSLTATGDTGFAYPEIPVDPDLTHQLRCGGGPGQFCGLLPSQLVEIVDPEHRTDPSIQDWTAITPDMWTAANVSGNVSTDFIGTSPTETMQPSGLAFFGFDEQGETTELPPSPEGLAILETDPEWLRVLVRGG
ncbi:hypothetical protein PV08_06993 [Exophiala spinifera]|uniref:Uncharacterized protein n=1 Tax=Exophiala spinifera TaxID=91928 RepID=A0A0D1ZN00_9EURO|nr:uncharacterized protein PV08_06993 [Exophiala spinifera]KIW14212.1 hypothetical protein PV08_06993 [Exophiala spinifera]